MREKIKGLTLFFIDAVNKVRDNERQTVVEVLARFLMKISACL
jgi:restriction endonuclease